MITIRNMVPTDLDFAVSCTMAEGWNTESRDEFEGFLLYNPKGCFIAEINNKRSGIIVATPYEKSGFLGELVVVKEARGQKIGQILLDHAIQYLKDMGVHNFYLDGVIPAVPYYEYIGFKKICRSLRFKGLLLTRTTKNVRPMKQDDLPAVCEMDRLVFGADRGFFIKRRLTLYPELCKVTETNGQISGFIMGRRGNDIITAGPWIVHQSLKNPEDLLIGFASEIGPSYFNLAILENNKQAVSLVRSLGFAEKRNPPWRMFLGSSDHLGNNGLSYALGSAAKG